MQQPTGIERPALEGDVDPRPTRPVRIPLAYQDWSLVGFVHWRYPPQEVQRLLPDGLRVETFEGDAWVSLTPFLVRRMRFPGLPPLPRVSTYPETNLRTYVTAPDGSRGIWFFALDCGASFPVLLGRGVYFQPYHRSRLSVRGGATLTYTGERLWPRGKGSYAVQLEPGPVLEPDALTELDHFLTGRWILYTFYGPIPAAGYVEHEPWPLRRASILRCEQDLTQAAGLTAPASEPIAHYAEEVHAKLSPPRLLGG